LDYIETVKSDLKRYSGGKDSFWYFIKTYIRFVEFRYIFWFRTTAASRNSIIIRPLHYIFRYILLRKMISLGIFIAYNTEIKEGFYIGHFGNIIVHYMAKIGKNCNISSGVTIGSCPRGKNKGIPTIGDNVYIGPGAKIIGNVTVGNNVAIGANCVVTKDAPDNSVVAGIPGKIISYNGSDGYINFTS
jgi:serine O-acetyltransferase